jgi:putative peptidoglycan lipid II flippase
MVAMQREGKHPLIAAARATGIGTLASRVLGLVRDMVTASILGMSGTAVADAFVIAFRLPNLFRRLFGEGALTASYLPVFAKQLEADRRKAWKLASVLFAWLTIFLSGLTVVGELIFLAWGLVANDSPNTDLLLKLSAVTLPYMMLICLAAQISATLQALSNFTVPAWAPAMLNVCLILAAWFVAPHFAGNQEAQAFVLSIAVLIGGVAQVAIQWPSLRKEGFRFDYDVPAAMENLRHVGRLLLPMLVGLAVTQINTFSDSLIAWFFEAHRGMPDTIAWLGGVRYPMEQGAAAALYYGERMYEFPLGIVGMAVAAAIFPLLSRHAARGDHEMLGADLSLGLRMVISLGVPAGVGLIVLAQPLAKLLFEHGHFTAQDTARAASTTAWFAVSVWAYCAAPVVVRGFYALDDSRTPVRIGAWMVAFDLTLGLALIWPMAEAGLAFSTALSAVLQLILLAWLFSRKYAALRWKELIAAALRTVAASAVMAAVCYLALALLPAGSIEQKNVKIELLRVGVPVVCGAISYMAVYRLLGGREISMLWTGVEK